MIRFTKAYSRSRPAPVIKEKGGKQATLKKLKSFLDTEEPKTAQWLVNLWGAQGNAVTYKELREAYLSGGITKKQLDKWQKDYSNFVTTALAPQWQKAMSEAAASVKAEYPYFLYNPATAAAQTYIKQHVPSLVTALV